VQRKTIFMRKVNYKSSEKSEITIDLQNSVTLKQQLHVLTSLSETKTIQETQGDCFWVLVPPLLLPLQTQSPPQFKRGLERNPAVLRLASLQSISDFNCTVDKFSDLGLTVNCAHWQPSVLRDRWRETMGQLRSTYFLISTGLPSAIDMVVSLRTQQMILTTTLPLWKKSTTYINLISAWVKL
jgi:hypothetical protein